MVVNDKVFNEIKDVLNDEEIRYSESVYNDEKVKLTKINFVDSDNFVIYAVVQDV